MLHSSSAVKLKSDGKPARRLPSVPRTSPPSSFRFSRVVQFPLLIPVHPRPSASCGTGAHSLILVASLTLPGGRPRPHAPSKHQRQLTALPQRSSDRTNRTRAPGDQRSGPQDPALVGGAPPGGGGQPPRQFSYLTCSSLLSRLLPMRPLGQSFLYRSPYVDTR